MYAAAAVFFAGMAANRATPRARSAPEKTVPGTNFSPQV
jgi:hypothetical protein